MHAHPVFLFVLVGVAAGWDAAAIIGEQFVMGCPNSCLGGVARVIPIWEVGRSPGGRRRCGGTRWRTDGRGAGPT